MSRRVVNKTTSQIELKSNSLSQESLDSYYNKLNSELNYFKDIYDIKFNNLREILSQPIKKYAIKTDNPNALIGLKSDIYIRHEYQNIYSIYGKIEVINPKVKIPIFILPANLEAINTIIINAYAKNEKNEFTIIQGIIQDKYLIVKNYCLIILFVCQVNFQYIFHCN